MTINAADQQFADGNLEDAAKDFFSSVSADPEGGVDSGSVSTPPSGTEDLTPPASTTTEQAVSDLQELAWEDGVKLSKDVARSYVELDAYFTKHPDKFEAVKKLLAEGENQQAVPDSINPIPQQVPEITLDEFTDPAVKALYEKIQVQAQELENLRQETSGIGSFVSTQQEQQINSLLNRAVTSFQTQHNLTDDEMEKIKDATARLQVLPALMSPVDPLTNQPRQVDPLAAVEEAFNIVYWQIPEFRERAISTQIEDVNKDKLRKAKISSLQGSSGSIPRETNVPDDPKSRRDAMVNEVAQAMFGKE